MSPDASAAPDGAFRPSRRPPRREVARRRGPRRYIAGVGTFAVVPGSYAVTVQDPTGPGLFGDFVNDYAVGLAETTYPGPGAFLAGFAAASPDFVASAVVATTFAGDLGAIAEMYVPFVSGDELDFYLPAPVAGSATASIVPEPGSLALAGLALAALALGRRRAQPEERGSNETARGPSRPR